MKKYKVKSNAGTPPPVHRGRPHDKNSLRGQIRELKANAKMMVTDKDIRHVSATASQIAKETGREITTRSVDGGVEVWRTA